MTLFHDLELSFGDARNPRGWGISSDGMRFCGTYLSALPEMTDTSAGYTVSWSALGHFHADSVYDPAYAGFSCRGVNRRGDLVGFVVKRTNQPPADGAPGSSGYVGYPFYKAAHEDPVIFEFVDALHEVRSTPAPPGGAGDGLFGINDNGEVVGRYLDTNNRPVGFVASIATLLADPTAANPATLTPLSIMGALTKTTRGAIAVIPRGINNKGVIVGSARDGLPGIVTIDRVNYISVTIDNFETTVTGINDDGYIVGQFGPAASQRGFRWRVDAKGYTVDVPERVDYPVPFFSYMKNLRTSLTGIDNHGTAIGHVTYDDIASEPDRVRPFVHRSQNRAGLRSTSSAFLEPVSIFD